MAARAALLVVGILLFATACGGSSKKPPPATTTAAATSAAAKAHARASTKPSSTSSARGRSQSADASFASSGHCTLLRSLGAKISQRVPPTFKVSKTDIAAETAALRALADSAPSEIRADFRTYVDVFSRYMQVYSSIGLRPGKALTHADYLRVTKAVTQTINTPGLTAAEQHLKRWVRAHCPKAPPKG